MKKALLLLCVFLSCMARSQTWCPPGAQWHYRVFSENPPYYNGFLQLNAIGTSTLGGQLCHLIKGDYYGSKVWPNNPNDTTYNYSNVATYENNKVIYVYDSTYQRFDTIANFNANPGDSWLMIEYVGTPNENTCFGMFRPKVTVVDTGHVLINSQFLKKIVVTTSNNFSKDTLIEKIGSICDFLFPYFHCGSDGPYFGRFVCYSDLSFPLYKKPAYTLPCDFHTAGTEEFNLQNLRFRIYPNPSSTGFSIEVPNSNESLLLKLNDALGREVGAQNINKNTQINTENLPEGIYLLKVVSDEHKVLFQTKLVKEK